MPETQEQVTAYWQRTLAGSRQLAFVMDTSRCIVAMSDRMASLCGGAAADLVGHTCVSLMHGTEAPDDCPLHELLLHSGQHEGEVYSESLERNLFITVTPLPDEYGQVTHVLHVAVDVTERRRAEKALRENEERFAALFDDAPLGYQSLDEEGFFLEVNSRWLETLGYSRDEVVGRWFGDFLAPEFVDAFRQRFPLFKEQGFVHSEFEMLRKDGERRTIAFEGRIGHNPDGSFRQTHCILSDVTERLQIEAALRQSEARHARAQEVGHIGSWEYDPRTTLWWGSPEARRLYGLDPDTPAFSTEQIARTLRDPERVLGALPGLLERGGSLEMEYEILPAGSTEPRVVWSVAEVERDEKGIPVLVTGVIQDVTGRKRAEQALIASEDLLRQAQDVARLGHYVLDVSAGMWTSSSTLDGVFGIDADFARSIEGWLEIVHPDERAEVDAYFRGEVLGEQKPFDREYRIQRISDGAERWVHGVGTLEQGADGRLSRMFGIIQDVTERRLAEEQVLQQKERLRRTLEGAVEAMGQLVEGRDPYTAGHERRVAELACAIAVDIEWSAEAVEVLRTAALVHDIGKNAVPAEILNKPGRLSKSEFDLIKVHSRSGFDVLAPIDFGAPVAEIVLQHHERLDGSGYPEGLHGDEILPAARVLAIADVVEAMVTHRPYRPALPVEDALAEINSGLGLRYDREAGQACLHLLRAEGFAFTNAG